ncbi:MAG: divalent-cation tolerance protein CutA [Acidobacteriota bacterium]|nr:divalent-cation tolerance protein CutA [Acidobacteriota bacterium]
MGLTLTDTQFVLVLTTFPASGNAEQVATQLVEESLAACVNISAPMRSIYRWQGTLERSDELQLLIKTTLVRLPLLEARLKSLHPYDLPEFLVIPVIAGSRDYLFWVAETTA